MLINILHTYEKEHILFVALRFVLYYRMFPIWRIDVNKYLEFV